MGENFQGHISMDCLLINTKGTAVLSVSAISCSLSILGTAIILYSYVRLRNIRDDTRMLLLFLTVADILSAAAYLIGPIYILNFNLENIKTEFHSSPACVVQSFISTFSSMASFFWTVAIATHIYLRLVHYATYAYKKMVFLCVLFICWGVPAVISIIALMLSKLGANFESTGPWCWIRSDLGEDEMIFWMILAGKGWELASYFVAANLCILAKIQIYLRQKRNRRQNTGGAGTTATAVDVSYRKSLLFLLLALYLLRLWGTSRFVINVLIRAKELNCVVQYILLLLQSYGDSGQGFWNFVIFCCLDKSVKFRLLFNCCRSNENNAEQNGERERLLESCVRDL